MARCVLFLIIRQRLKRGDLFFLEKEKKQQQKNVIRPFEEKYPLTPNKERN